MRGVVVALVTLLIPIGLAREVAAQAGYITTIAGNGTPVICDADPPPGCITASGDGGPALAAGFGYTMGIALDSAENLYIVDYYGHRVRRVDAATGIITTFAGNGASGTGGDGGPATSAQLWYPVDVALDAAGNVYISMLTGDMVRKVDAVTGIITRVAGGGYTLLPAAEGIAATEASLGDPGGIAIDPIRNLLYVSESHPSGYHRVRRVDLTTGIITTLAGTGPPGAGGYNGDDIRATSARLNRPGGLAVDAAGNVYITDVYNHRVRRVDVATGIITTVAGTGDGTPTLEDDGLLATQARVHYPSWLAFDAAGNLFISSGQVVRSVGAQTGIITTVAGTGAWGFGGDGGPATAAYMKYPHGLVFDRAGNLLISDSGNQRIRRVESAGPPANQAPVAVAAPDQQTAIVGEAASFDGSASHDPDGPIAEYAWEFGDGSTGSGATAVHAYASGGTFAVTLIVTDQEGAADDETVAVTVITPLEAIEGLEALVESYNIQQGISNSLDAKLAAVTDAITAANAGLRQDAANKLGAFMASVEAQRGKELSDAQADELVGWANRILGVM